MKVPFLLNIPVWQETLKNRIFKTRLFTIKNQCWKLTHDLKSKFADWELQLFFSSLDYADMVSVTR